MQCVAINNRLGRRALWGESDDVYVCYCTSFAEDARSIAYGRNVQLKKKLNVLVHAALQLRVDE